MNQEQSERQKEMVNINPTLVFESGHLCMRQWSKWHSWSDRAGWRECFLLHAQQPVAGRWVVSGQGNKQPHSTAAALPAITNQPLAAETLSGPERNAVTSPCGVLNCSSAERGPEHCHHWNSAALALTLKIWFCASGQAQRSDWWVWVG